MKKFDNEDYSPLFKLLPNLVTFISLCLALSAIKFAIDGNFVKAVSFVIIAAFMDGVDGRLARFLNSASNFGAELDSLADFVNFGVVPGIVIYLWINVNDDIKGFDWAMVLFFSICSAIRLARFNTDLKEKNTNPILEKYFFKGIPMPCGAAIAFLPIIFYHEFGDGFYNNSIFIIGYVFTIAIVMASRVPTISIKKISIKNDYIYITLVIFAVLIIGLIIKPWITLSLVGIVYLFSIPITTVIFFKIKSTLNKK